MAKEVFAIHVRDPNVEPMSFVEKFFFDFRAQVVIGLSLTANTRHSPPCRHKTVMSFLSFCRRVGA